MGCNLQLASAHAALLGRPRTSGAFVKEPINLLDEFKFHMSLKWMLPWWLADPTNCCGPPSSPILPTPYGLPPPPLALLPFSTWRSREWGFVSSGPMSHVKDAWSDTPTPPQPLVTLPPTTSLLLCHTTHFWSVIMAHAHCTGISIPMWPCGTMTLAFPVSPLAAGGRKKKSCWTMHWSYIAKEWLSLQLPTARMFPQGHTGWFTKILTLTAHPD